MQEIIKFKFLFENTGNRPLQIFKAIPGCGCTIPSNPFIDISPGDKGYIGGTYNSVGKLVGQVADIVVHSNADRAPHTICLVEDAFPKSSENIHSTQ